MRGLSHWVGLKPTSPKQLASVQYHNYRGSQEGCTGAHATAGWKHSMGHSTAASFTRRCVCPGGEGHEAQKGTERWTSIVAFTLTHRSLALRCWAWSRNVRKLQNTHRFSTWRNELSRIVFKEAKYNGKTRGCGNREHLNLASVMKFLNCPGKLLTSWRFHFLTPKQWQPTPRLTVN